MLLGKCSSSCLHSGAACGICRILAETISVACSEHSNQHEAFDLDLLYLHEIKVCHR